MKALRRIVLLGIITTIAVITISCKKTEEDPGGNNITPITDRCYVQKFYYYPSAFIQFKFQYDENFKIIRIDGEESGYLDFMIITYNTEGKISRIEHFDSESTMNAYQDFQYTNGIVTSAHEYSNNEYEYTYNYNSQGLLSSINIAAISMMKSPVSEEVTGNSPLLGKYFSNWAAEGTGDSKAFVGNISFIWDGNANIIKETWTSGGGSFLFSYEHASYDNKQNAIAYLNFPIRAIGGPYSFTLSANNFTQVTHTSTSGTESANIEYQYSNKGYPTMMTYLGQSQYKLEYLCDDCQPLPTIANAGPDQIGIQDTITSLEGNTPKEGIGTWKILIGENGKIIDKNNPTSEIHGSDSMYVVDWTIENECGKSSGQVIINFDPNGSSIMGDPCPGLPEFSYEGQTYKTVQIGNQCWMRENLNVGISINSSEDQSNNLIIEKYCYDDDDLNCNVYGGLYQWDELMMYETTQGSKGICPEGWHIPDFEEVSTLIDYLGGESVAGGKMKEAGTLHWSHPNYGATNISGFTALPGGLFRKNEGYLYLNEYGNIWSSTQENIDQAWRGYLEYDTPEAKYGYSSKTEGRSVRCIKD
jgi:uncharacterized protein (TIGR02145 family)